MYKLKVRNGKVSALLKTGKDLVKTEVYESFAKKRIDEVGCVNSDRTDTYQLKVGEEWYFEGTYQEDKEEVAIDNDTSYYKKKKDRFK